MRMFGIERLDQIVGMLGDERPVSVREMARRLFVSEATVRRDLDILERRGLVRRLYGGAVLVRQTNRDVPLYLREGEEAEAKNTIGRKAAALVGERDVILLDASSTAFHVVRHLTATDGLVAITSGLKAAMALGERHIKTLCTGGAMIDNSYSFIGRHAEALIENLHVDIMFFSCRGVSRDGLMTDTSVEETQLRQTMLCHAKRRILLCTPGKIGREYFYRLGHVHDIDDVICEGETPAAWRRGKEREDTEA